MKKLLIVFSAVAFVLSACQKEASFEDPNSVPGNGGPGTTPTGQLTRLVFVAGADSSATDYGYDASKRLSTVAYTTTSGGNQLIRLYRNATGVLTKFSTKSDDLASIGVDSVVTLVNYNSTQARYTYSLSSVSVGGIEYRDSTVFTYNSSGNIGSKTDYAKAGPANYEPYVKTDYTYAGGNVVAEQYSSYDVASSSWMISSTYNYAYDAKVNPVKLGAEAFIALDDATYFSDNNATGFDYVDSANAANNFSLTTTLTYNTANKPSSGTAVENPGANSYNLRYYYN